MSSMSSSLNKIGSRLHFLLLIMLMFCGLSLAQTSPSPSEIGLRVYVPGGTIARRAEMLPIVIECTVPQGVSFDRVVVESTDESNLSVKSDPPATTPISDNIDGDLVLSYKCGGTPQAAIVHLSQPVQLVTIRPGIAFFRTFLYAPLLGIGDVDLRAHFLVKGQIRASSPTVRIQCVEDSAPMSQK